MTQQAYDYGAYSDGYMRAIPNQRMYVRANVHLPCGEVDPRTGMPVHSGARRGRTQAKRMELGSVSKEIEREEHASRGPKMTFRAAFMLVMATAFTLCILFLVQQGQLTSKQKQLNDVRKDISLYQSLNLDLEARIAEASDPAKICYRAAKELGMIPCESASAIYLLALDTRPGSGGVMAHDMQPESMPVQGKR